MSLYETTATEILFDNMKCQYDMEGIASSQCSWFCYAILNEIKKNKWTIPQGDKFCELYTNALVTASKYRKTHGQVPWGESIFSDVIFNFMSFDISRPYQSCVNGESNPLINNNMLKYKTYKDNLQNVPLSTFMLTVKRIYGERKFMLVNRFGQSFVIIPDYEHSAYYIFDSHQRCVGRFNSDGIIKYILVDSSSTSQIIWLTGNMTNDKILPNVRKNLFIN